MSQRKAKTPVAAIPIPLPRNVENKVHTKQLELGAVTVVLHMYPDKIPLKSDADELCRRQVQALRQFADMWETAAGLADAEHGFSKGGDA